MINPEEFLGVKPKKEQTDYSRFQKMDASYNCNHDGCNETSSMSYLDFNNGLIMWVCMNGHENKATLK